jgi:hypothetical protein
VAAVDGGGEGERRVARGVCVRARRIENYFIFVMVDSYKRRRHPV